MMTWFLAWLVAVELLGLAALPVSTLVLRPLSDRGYIFAKPLGLLLVGYLCWLLGIFGMLRFQQATIAAVLVLLGVVSWILWGRETVARLAPLRRVLLAQETIFLAFFVVAALIRAHSPDISGTEKPMDFALLNGIYRSDVFPPEDPWMSGFSISYYYFGYLLMATATKLSGVPPAVGYNLAVALVHSLFLAGCLSLAFNLISALKPLWRDSQRLLGALAAPVLVGIMGNLEAGLELLAARGVGDASFWSWVGVKGLQAGPDTGAWLPISPWWWFRASRIIPTIKPDGIDEFPYFSFLLGDLHPHFIALPWVVLAIAMALAAIISGAAEDVSAGSGPGASRRGTAAVTYWASILVPAVSLGFLLVGNSWDFPTYTGLFWVATVAACIRPGEARNRLEIGRAGLWRAVRGVLPRLLLTSGLSVLMYAPFFLGFSSQTRGIGLSADKTPLPSMLIIFGPFLLVVGMWLISFAWPRYRPANRRVEKEGFERVPDLVGGSGREGEEAIRVEGAGVGAVALAESTKRGVAGWVLWGGGVVLIAASAVLGAVVLLLGFLLLVAAAARRILLVEWMPAGPKEKAERFLVILIVLGLLLILVPEYLFLVDLFGTRMNTVFKFHYQAWLMLGLAAAVGAVWMWTSLRRRATRLVAVFMSVLLVSVGLLYPLAATPSRIQDYQAQPTLDGAAFYQRLRPDDYAAIRWLSSTASGRPVVLEATGGEYSEYARVSTFSGLPTVLGWGGHEAQWRGSGDEAQRRTADIDAIYSTAERSQVLALLQKYRVRYVFVGTLEVERYGAGVLSRFDGLLEPVYRQGRVVVYRVPESRGQSA